MTMISRLLSCGCGYSNKGISLCWTGTVMAFAAIAFTAYGIGYLVGGHRVKNVEVSHMGGGGYVYSSPSASFTTGSSTTGSYYIVPSGSSTGTTITTMGSGSR